jgi:ribosome maturation factor RimP
VIGHEVRLRTKRPIEGRKRYRGRLLSIQASDVEGESAVLEINVDGAVASVPFDDIEKANAIYEFTSEDFSKKKPSV